MISCNIEMFIYRIRFITMTVRLKIDQSAFDYFSDDRKTYKMDYEYKKENKC